MLNIPHFTHHLHHHPILFEALTMLHPQIRQITVIAMGHSIPHTQIALPTHFLIRALVRRQEALALRRIASSLELRLLFLDLSAVLAADESWEEFVRRIRKGHVGGVFLGGFEGLLHSRRRRDFQLFQGFGAVGVATIQADWFG